MMLFELGKAAAVIIGLFLVWVAVQSLKRRSDPRFRRGDDVLAGCGTCAISDACHAAEPAAGACSTGEWVGKE